MKQKLTTTLILAFICATTWAGPVGLEQAKGKAAKFFKEQNRGAKLATDTPEYAPARRIRGIESEDKAPAYYVFNAEDEMGYVIISGEDNTDEILGYSNNGSFDMSTMPSNVKAWLQGYAEQIAMMENYTQQENTRTEQWAAISPLIKTEWNQDGPYNTRCPAVGKEKSVTGCTATATAQIMKYHEWPQDKCSKIPGFTTETKKFKLSALSPTTFRWDQMANYYSKQEKDGVGDAVAELMRYCGQALKSDYTLENTGAYIYDATYALQEYFDYDQNIEHKYLYFHTISEWESIIYEELKANRPVLHGGNSFGGGHAFVCDGYDGDGMFHINWGWGGAYDGFFKLTLLNPTVGEIGSGTIDGYSSGQQIVVGIQPPTGEEAKPRYFYPSDEQIVNEHMFSYFYNTHTQTLTANVGFATIDENNEIIRVLKDCGPLTLDGNLSMAKYVHLNIKEDGVSLQPGIHHIATVCRPKGAKEWKRVGSSQNYFIVRMGFGNRIIEMSMSPKIDVAITKVDCNSNLVAGMTQNLTIGLWNQGDEFYSDLYVFASKTQDKGEALGRTTAIMKKDEQVELPLYFTPTSAGRHNIWIAKDAAGTAVVIDTFLVFKEPPTQPADLTMFSCIPNKKTLEVTATIKNNSTEGYYRGIVAILYENLYDDGNLYGTEILELPGDIMPGRTKTFKFNFRGAQSYNECAILIGYYKKHTDKDFEQLGDYVRFKTEETPVESIEGTRAEEDAPIFRIDGTRVKDSDAKGIFITNGKKMIAK